MVHGGHDHADLEAHDENGCDHFVLRRAVIPQVNVIRPAQGQEQEPAKDVTPNVDRLVGPPENTLQAEPRWKDVPVAASDERVELQILWRLLVRE